MRGVSAVVGINGGPHARTQPPPGDRPTLLDGSRLPVLPTVTSLAACEADIEVTDVSLTGTGSDALKTVAPLLRSTLGSELSGVLCKSLAPLGISQLSKLMKARTPCLSPS